MARVSLILIFLNASNICASPLIFSHRAGMGHFPQASTAALRHSVEIGVDFIELDLRLSKDKMPIAYHDEHLNPRLCKYKDGRPLTEGIAVDELTVEQLKEVRCGHVANPEFPSQIPAPNSEILTLPEVFEFVASLGANPFFMFELKSISISDYKVFIEQVMGITAAYEMVSNVNLQSANLALRAGIAAAKKMQCLNFIDDILPISDEWASAFVIKSAQRLGKRVVVYTVNNPCRWQTMIERGVDGIITDYPKDLQEFLRKYGEHKGSTTIRGGVGEC